MDDTGSSGNAISSRRVKDDIRDMDDASAGLGKLRPVTFRYKAEPATGPRLLEYGLIAEEVAEIYPELVVLDKDGQPSGVRYHVLPAMLLNELQRQQRVIEGASLAADRVRRALPRPGPAHRRTDGAALAFGGEGRRCGTLRGFLLEPLRDGGDLAFIAWPVPSRAWFWECPVTVRWTPSNAPQRPPSLTGLKCCRSLVLVGAHLAQLDRASDYESEGRGFDSLRARSERGVRVERLVGPQRLKCAHMPGFTEF